MTTGAVPFAFLGKLLIVSLLLGSVGCSGADEEDAFAGFDASFDARNQADAEKPPSPSPAGDAGAVATSDAGADAAPKPWPCLETAHIGDSLTAGVIPKLTTEYEDRGVDEVTISAGGGRSVLQKVSADKETGKAAAARIRAEGFAGCWVIALGTNDTANIAAGASYTRASAIDQMMTAIDETKKAPVMWVNTFSTRTSGYYDNKNMILWNQALTDAKVRWPNLRIFDWAKIAALGTAPFSDGLHHTSAGYVVRNDAIADALLATFPK